MMTIFGVLNILTAFNATLAATIGEGRAERIGWVILALAGISLFLTRTTPETAGGMAALFFVDAALLIGFILLAVRSSFYWPVWASGLQILIVLAHLVRLTAAPDSIAAYIALLMLWKILILVFIAAGTILDRRSG